ncbi:hypothetical protein LPJ64_001724 [Coemansia asiatica]|uniref:BHLH domain-containing protein n=1 Tax=Coemansia asiatica TaxID=1052880 RepID=A0A9W7XPH5_9FUNG|nr:hypothetical protein LPJ64_001724 [Coemansia asiatica]
MSAAVTAATAASAATNNATNSATNNATNNASLNTATPSSSSLSGAAESRGGNSSDIDSEVQSNKPLFLNFTAELAPFNGAGKKQKKKSNVYKVSGVNILNRNSVDSKTALERLQRRRENHNFVERRRRDNINHTITSLSTLIPYCNEDGVKLNKGSILHMAVDYIRDLQEINQALAEENVRLGGSGNPPLPGRRSRDCTHSSSADTTAPHSHDEAEYDDDDDDEDDEDVDAERTLPQSLAASPSTGPSAAASITTAVAAAIAAEGTPKRRRTSPAQAAKPSSAKPKPKPKPASVRKPKPAAKSRTAATPHHALPGVLSPPLTTAAPSAAASTNTSPIALAAMLAPSPAARPGSSGRSANPPAVSLPPISLAQPTHQHHPSLLPALSQLGATLVRRQPAAQSMPSSPCFRAHQPGAVRIADHAPGARHMPSIASHPFFNSDVSSIRHHMQQQQQHQQQPLPSVFENQEPGCAPVSAGLHPPHARSRPPAFCPQSLQNTPLMRPARDFAKDFAARDHPADAFELPPLPSLQQQQQQQ